ncbi:MAG: FKBP-type peptidyl-prolyl cis-trans isomerase [Myxococcota bacterium]
MTKMTKWAAIGIVMNLMLVSGTQAAPESEKSAAESDRYAAPADVAKAPADATRTASGLAYKVLTQGKGTVHPKPTDRVTVNYTGWETNGRMFDSSYKRGKPATFPLNRVIKGWTEGLQLMVVGDTVRLWIPPELAYGKVSRGGRPSGELVFDVELLEIN